MLTDNTRNAFKGLRATKAIHVFCYPTVPDFLKMFTGARKKREMDWQLVKISHMAGRIGQGSVTYDSVAI